MSLTQGSLRRPVTTVMVCLAIVLLGVIAWPRLPQELFPPITYPQLTVVTRYKDAAPEEIELLVTKPIEEVVGTVSGLRRVSSISKEELSLVIAEFNWDTQMDFAALGVREKIDLIKERLPRGSEDPVVIKYNPFERPVMVLNLSGDISSHELLTLARKQVKNELEKLEGVAVVNLSGGLEREILVEVDQARLQAAALPISHVTDALSRANLNYPAGTIKEAFYEYLIRTIGEFSLVREIPNIAVGVDEEKETPEQEYQKRIDRPGPLKKDKGMGPGQRLIMLKDLATVKDTFRDRDSISRFNGRDNVSLSIQKQAGANTLRLAKQVKEAIDRIKLALPPGAELTIAYDQSTAIENAVNGVLTEVLQGGALAFLVLFLILGNIWSAINISFAIPISVLATLGLMYFSGTTVNIISMGGLALGIGMLVDAGIVVVENISRYREKGVPPREAARQGTAEVASAIGGSVLTTVVVFLPMVFVVGIAGQLFKDLAYTVIFSLLTSWGVSLTLTALFASLYRGPTQSRSPIEPLLQVFYRLDDTAVRWFLRNRIFGAGLMLALLTVSLFVLKGSNFELMPRIDQGQFIVHMNLQPGNKLEVTDRVATRAERVLQAMPEVRDVTVTVGSSKQKRAEELLETLGTNEAQIFVNLWPKKNRWGGSPADGKTRSRSTADVVQELKETLGREPLEGAEIEYLLQESIFQSVFAGGAPVVVEVKGTDLSRIEMLAGQVKSSLEEIPGLYSVRTSMIPASPETKVHVLKDRAATYHLSVSDIALTAQTAFKGFVATKFKEEGKEIDIRVRLRKEDRNDLSRVRQLLVHSPLEIDVPLAEVAYLTTGKGPTEIRHLDQQRTVLVSAQVFQRPLKAILADVSNVTKKLPHPSEYTVNLTGEQQEIQESYQSLAFALILSLLLVYMVMASELESLWQPLLIMATIPMSLIGVALGLSVTQTPISVMVGLGLIVLVGVVVDNGIVLVEFINELRREGMGLEEAVVEASRIRLRPILLTAGTTTLGLLPLTLGWQQGAELQIPMGITMMWGLSVSTFFTLIYLPTIYVIGARFFEGLRKAAHLENPVPVMVPAFAAVSLPEPVLMIPAETVEPVSPVTEIELSPEPPALSEPPAPPDRPEVPEIPIDFGSEDAVTDKPEFPFLPGGPMFPLPEPPAAEEIPPVSPPVPSEPLPTIPELVFETPPEPEPPVPPVSSVEEAPASVPPEAVDPMLNPRQQRLLDYLKTKGRITRKEYVDLTGASVPTAARDLKELVDRGLVKGVGPLARGRYYVLA